MSENAKDAKANEAETQLDTIDDIEDGIHLKFFVQHIENINFLTFSLVIYRQRFVARAVQFPIRRNYIFKIEIYLFMANKMSFDIRHTTSKIFPFHVPSHFFYVHHRNWRKFLFCILDDNDNRYFF